MGMQRALGLPGGARGVDQQRRILGVRIERRELVRRRRQPSLTAGLRKLADSRWRSGEDPTSFCAL